MTSLYDINENRVLSSDDILEESLCILQSMHLLILTLGKMLPISFYLDLIYLHLIEMRTYYQLKTLVHI